MPNQTQPLSLKQFSRTKNSKTNKSFSETKKLLREGRKKRKKPLPDRKKSIDSWLR